MMKAPASVPLAVPIPPEKLVPPMMADVIASNSAMMPAFGRPGINPGHEQHTRNAYKHTIDQIGFHLPSIDINSLTLAQLSA